MFESSVSISPLRSSLLEKEPELIDLIKKYVNKYPEMVCDLKSSYDKNSVDEFNQRLHDLKSTGGNYGFMLITELAIKTKDFLYQGNDAAVNELLIELENLHARMLLGIAD